MTGIKVAHKTKEPQEGKTGTRAGSVLLGVGVYAVIGLFVVWNSQAAQRIVGRNAWPLGILLALGLVAVLVSWYRSGKTDAPGRIALFAFLSIPVLFGLVLAIVVIPDVYQVSVLRGFFLVIVCLLPATMYYLFIAGRKKSLLQEFFTNLARLGLLKREALGGTGRGRQGESEMERNVRVMSYIQKFEAVYGPISKEVAGEIITASNPDNPDPRPPRFHEHGTGGTFEGVFAPQTTIPVVLATLLIGLGWLLTLPVWEIVSFDPGTPTVQRLRHVLQPGGIAVHFALLGAYFFSLQMLFRRYVRKDLQANAYMAVSLRVILAVIGTWAVIQAVTFLNLADQTDGKENEALLVIGFVVGAFPPIAWQFVRSAFRKITSAEVLVPSLSTEMPVSDLDGLTVWHEARLEEEDIENVPNMATADMVELMLHTRLPPDRIVDWVDQAILYTHLGPSRSAEARPGEPAPESRRQLLRRHGIRTASALVAAHQHSKARGDLDSFESILPGSGRKPIRTLVDVLSTNPNLVLIQQWRRLSVPQRPAAVADRKVNLSSELAAQETMILSHTPAGGRQQVVDAMAAQDIEGIKGETGQKSSAAPPVEASPPAGAGSEARDAQPELDPHTQMEAAAGQGNGGKGTPAGD